MIPHDSKWNWNHTVKLLLSLNLCEWIKTWSFHCIAPFQSFISESTPKLQEAFKPNLLVSGAVLWCMCLTKGWVKANCNREIHAFLLLTMNVSASAKKINLETTIQLSPLLKYHCLYWSLCIETLPQKGLNKKQSYFRTEGTAGSIEVDHFGQSYQEKWLYPQLCVYIYYIINLLYIIYTLMIYQRFFRSSRLLLTLPGSADSPTECGSPVRSDSPRSAHHPCAGGIRWPPESMASKNLGTNLGDFGQCCVND